MRLKSARRPPSRSLARRPKARATPINERNIYMKKKMKLTKYQQEMLDGKHGEAKQFCMDKLMDFGKAVEATEMVDLVLTLNCCPIYVKDRMEPERLKKLN